MTSPDDARTLGEFLNAFAKAHLPGKTNPQIAPYFEIGEKAYRDWLSGKTQPTDDKIKLIARKTGVSQALILALAGRFDDDVIALALSADQTTAAVSRGIRRIEDLAAGAQSSLASAAAASGRWEVVVVPRHRSVSLPSATVRVHWGEYVGFRPSATSQVTVTSTEFNSLAVQVIDEFRELVSSAAAMPEDEIGVLEGLSARYESVKTWFKVNRFTTNPPGPAPARLGTVRRLFVLGTHYGGQDQVGAMLANALGWGFVNTSFTAARFFPRSLAEPTEELRRRAQLAHDTHGLTVARAVITKPEFDDHVLALGNPNMLAEVTRLAAGRDGSEDRVLLFVGEDGLEEMAERDTVLHPDEVNAARTRELATDAVETLAARVENDTARILRTRPADSEAAFFEQYGRHFGAVYGWLMDRDGAPLPRDATYRALVEG